GTELGVDDISLVDLIKMYPNPVVNELTINTNGIQLEQVIVYDVLGKIIIDTKLNLETINTSTLKSGLYILKIKTAQGTVIRRITKR
ncbi:T9SS type A sorting domain-containing protein, partial [bacterium]|nr:T9SS type A sorting domain-containing protein [bacterium]